jgi:hypothetical protein
MASVIGAGAPYFASWPDRADAANSPTIPAEKSSAPELSSEIRTLLDRTNAALERAQGGLSLAELRAAVGVSTQDLRLAIEAGLRARAIRRTGSHNTLRYLSNAHR